MRRRMLERMFLVAGILLLVVGVGTAGYVWWSERQYQVVRPTGPPAEDLPERFEVPAVGPPATPSTPSPRSGASSRSADLMLAPSADRHRRVR